jgi:outer membrane protein OmpA-like peptidoglycan-associated protein
MKTRISVLTLALGLAATSCAGVHKQAAEPSENTDDAPAVNARARSDHEKSAESAATPTGPSPTSSSLAPLESASPGMAVPASGGSDNAQTNAEQADEEGAGKCRESSSGLALSVDRKTVSLEEGRLVAKMDGPICSLVLRIMLKDGDAVSEKAFRYTGPEREIRWTPVPREQIEKIEIRVSSKDGGYQSVFLIPWSVTIDHREVEFDTNKAVIRESEVASLVDSLDKIREVLAKVEGKELGTITLFIAGHTDTQGSEEHNLILSRNRAQAIAAWFMQRGLCIPIAFEGFGETALKKLTADGVDEQANRRVDYILSVEPPMIKKGATPAWKWLSKGC